MSEEITSNITVDTAMASELDPEDSDSNNYGDDTGPLVLTEQDMKYFYAAARDGDLDTILKYLDGSIDAKGNEGNVALMVSCQEGNTSIVQLLLDRGADVNARTQEGKTPLFKAVDEGHVETTTLLLDRGADINARTVAGVTPLMRAALGHIEIVELLLNRGADYHAKTNFGETALYYAAVEKHRDIVSLLRSRGAKK